MGSIAADLSANVVEGPVTPVVVVTHGAYGVELAASAEQLAGALGVAIVAVPFEASRQDIVDAVERAAPDGACEGGALLLTDVFGGTPANICLDLIGRHRGWEMVSGVNLMMLLKLATTNRRLGAVALAQQLAGTTRRSVQLGSDVLSVL